MGKEELGRVESEAIANGEGADAEADPEAEVEAVRVSVCGLIFWAR